MNGEIFLRDFIEACSEADMNPFLMWGTLLGCVREGGFLKYDHDIDVGILARDWPKRSLLIEAMRRRGYGLEYCNKYKIRFIGRDLLGKMDVDVFFPWEGKMICCLDHETDKSGAWFPLDAFNNFRSLTFLDTRVSIPDPPERVLETAYGDWRTPVKKYECFSIPNWLHIADDATWPKLPEDCI
jgi:phosphorylcholine metabolism protein LicD